MSAPPSSPSSSGSGPGRAAAVVLFSALGFFIGIATPVWFSSRKAAAAGPAPEGTPVESPAGKPEPAAVSKTSPPDPGKPPEPSVDWTRKAGLTTFATQCLASAARDPEAFAKSLAARAGSLEMAELETAVWALSQARPDLGARVVTGMKNPWLCAKTAPLIASGIAPGDDALREEVFATLRLPGSSRRQLETSATTDRAEADGPWAERRLAESPSAREKLSLLLGLARTDPAHALELAGEHKAPQTDLRAILAEVAATDPGAALDLAEKLEKPAAAAFLGFLLFDGKTPVTAAELKKAESMIKRYGDTAVSGPYHAGLAISGLVQSLLPRDPAKAAELLEKVPENQRERLVPSVALAMSGQDWRKAVDWIQAERSGSAEAPEGMYGAFAYEWAAAAPENLQETLTRDPNLPGREQFLAALQNHQRQKGDAAYQRWTKGLPPALKVIVKHL